MPTESESSFEHLVRTHAGDLYRYAYSLARDRQRAEDAVQEALLRGWRAYPRLRDRGAARSWLFSIVRNEFYRRAARDAPFADAVDVEAIDLADERASLAGLEMRVAVREIFLNCPRYVHRARRVERSPFVPTPGRETPVPDWKRRELVRDALPARDRARLERDEPD